MLSCDIKRAVIILSVMIVGILFFPASSVWANALILDPESAFSEDEYFELTKYAEEISAKTGWNIAVEFVPDGDFDYESSAYNHCVRSFENTFGNDADGVYYYCADHYVYLITSGSATDYITERESGKVARLGDALYPTDRTGSIELVLDGVYDEYDEGITIFDMSIGAPAAIVGVIGVIIYLIVVISAYKVNKTPSAAVYIDGKTVRFPVKQDIFVREYTTSYSTGSGSGHHGGGHHSGGHHSGGRR